MVIKNQTIATHQEIYVADIHIENGLITKVIKKSDQPNFNNVLLPGFVDIHTHGGYGWEFNDLTNVNYQLSLQKYLKSVPQEGVTNVLGTTVSCSYHDLLQIANHFYQALSTDKNAIILGWYLEGPFLAKAKKGAHNAKYIKPLNNDVIEFVKNNTKLIKTIAIAPEVSKNASYIHTLAKSTAVALGHSQASAITALKAITNGASRYIHLYNAMAPFSHRNPSILNAALLKNHAYVELITDGIHVDPLVLKTTYQTLSANSIIIVSDTLSCKGLKNGRYKLGDLDIIKHTNIATLASDNTIAGAVMPYNLQVANFYKATKCSLTDIVKMTSYNPIRAINMHQSVGQIAPNYWANFVVIDKKFNVLKTIIKGQEVYRK